MKSENKFNRLFIFEMANNHSGDVDHGIRIIKEIAAAAKKYDFNYAFKFQYRNLDTFIHPDFQGRDDIKYVKRFSETAIPEEDFLAMKKEVENQGMMTVCTPFDEASVDKIVEHNYDVIKIGSCSFNDWPLLEKIAATDKPVIASTASASFEQIDQVVSFFEHRDKELCIMHCVGAYPTPREDLQMNQLGLLQKRYPELPIGFSTHEEPSNIDSIKVAVGMGVKVFERHVAVDTEKYGINAYSSTPEQVENWLASAADAYVMSGTEGERHPITEKELTDLRGLKRGVWAKHDLKAGEKLTSENVFYAIPCSQEQIVANDMSKYSEYVLKSDVPALGAINLENTEHRELRADVLRIIGQVKEIIVKSHIALPNKIDLELSHHYGIEKYEECGAAILNCINREYCKKLIIILPGQDHPFHRHVKKEETFQVLYGDMDVNLDGNEQTLKAGDMLTVERNVNHKFSSKTGCVFEEVSTTHYVNDSFYEDEAVMNNPNRKTKLTFRSDWLYKDIK
jgi:N-acetylneuraminate synthase